MGAYELSVERVRFQLIRRCRYRGGRAPGQIEGIAHSGQFWCGLRGLCQPASQTDLDDDGDVAGVWGALFASSELLILVVRREEDHWNSVCAGFIVASLLQFRLGAKRAMVAGLFGAAFMGMFEGVGMLMQHQGDAALWGTKDHKGVSFHTPRHLQFAQQQQQQQQEQGPPQGQIGPPM